jgi:hypothetical protein
MRRLIVPLVVVTLLIGAEAAAREVEGRVPDKLEWDTQFSQDKAEQIAAIDGPLDIVFTGSSVAQANFDPVVFTQRASQFTTGYNAGLPSVTPRVWRQFLLDTVYAQHCPSVLVIAVDIRQFNDNKPGSDGQLFRYNNSKGRLEAVGQADLWQRAEDWLESNSALFRTRARLREPDKVLAWAADIGEKGDWRNTNLSPEGRYQSNDSRTYEASEERLESQRTGAFKDLSFGNTETNALRGIIDDALERGVVPLLVETPTMRNQLAKALPNGEEDFVWFSEILSGIADEYGVPLLRFPEMDNEPIYYSDDYHMNWTGIEFISRRLAEEVDVLNLDIGSGVCPASP